MTERTKQGIIGKVKQAGSGNEVEQVQQDFSGAIGQVAGTARNMRTTRQSVRGKDNQVAGRDIINIEHLTITSEHGSVPMNTAAFDQDFVYGLSEEQHTSLYQAKHLLVVLDGLAMVSTTSDKRVDIPRESLAIVFGLARDLVEKGMPVEGSGSHPAQ
jgi:hypothetical protein